jgi:CheY-like chemotaxis protein
MSQEVALDYFLVTRHSFQWSTHVPPFVIGRVLYDNWLVDYAVHHMDTIDATRTIRALHQVRPSMAHRRVPLALTRITLP